MTATRIVEYLFGAVATIAFFVTLWEFWTDLDTLHGHERDGTEAGRRYARHRVSQGVFRALTQLMMMLAAAAALSQSYLPGHQPWLATTLIAALCLAEVSIVVLMFRRIRVRTQLERAVNIADRLRQRRTKGREDR